MLPLTRANSGACSTLKYMKKRKSLSRNIYRTFKKYLLLSFFVIIIITIIIIIIIVIVTIITNHLYVLAHPIICLFVEN